MMRAPTPHTTKAAGTTLLLLSLLLRAPGAFAEMPEPLPPAPGDSQVARAVLAQMAAFLSELKTFRVDIASAHDSVQPTGQKLEFMDRRELTVRRPHDLRMEVVRSDGQKTVVTMNARTITAQHLNDNVYAQIDAKPTLDDSLGYFLNELRMRLPLAMLLASDLPQQFEKRIVQAEYIEETTILGKPAHHISGSTDTVDFQIWVGAGKQPLPLRIVLTYREVEGEPQFRALFSNWKLSPWTRQSAFEPRIGRGAKRIAFLTQIRTASAQADASPAASKGEKR